MLAALKAFFVCCLLGGAWCQQWSVSIPQAVEGLSGSCVLIPCSFSLPPEWDQHLDPSCKGIWKRGSWSRTQVFDSSLTGASAHLNILQGTLLGNLREKDCSTVFSDLPADHYDNYYFRLQCNNPLKFNFQKNVLVTVQKSLPKPTVTPARLEAEEGTTVTVSCSAVSPCPLRPPALTWTPSLGETEEVVDGHTVTSVMNFTVSSLHNGQTLSCSSLYSRRAADGDALYQSALTLVVFYRPSAASVSHSSPVAEGRSVTLTCHADANPAVERYSWFRLDGERPLEVGNEKILSTVVSEAESQFFCQVSNKYGSQNSSVTRLDVQFPPKETAVLIDPLAAVLEGGSVILLCRSRANPPVTNYTWLRDEEEGQDAGSVLVIESVELRHGGDYRCTATNELGEETSASIRLDVQYPPKDTSVTADPSGPALHGSSVTLTCSGAANPAAANFSWFRVAGGVTEAVGSDRDFTFTASKLSEDQYYCQALNVHGEESSPPVAIDVTFAPEILPSSRCVRILSQIRCSCDSQANPPPSLSWELAGQPVNRSADVPVREVALGGVGRRSLITLYNVDEEAPSLICLSINAVGVQSFAFNVSSSETRLGIHALSLLLGCAGGAAGMLLVCVPLLVYYCRKRKGHFSPEKGSADSSEILLVASENNATLIYSSKTTENGAMKEPLQHANGISKDLQARVESKPQEIKTEEPEIKPEIKTEEPEIQPEIKPEIKTEEPEIQLDEPEIKPEIKPEITGIKPEITPETKPENTLDFPEINPDEPEIKPGEPEINPEIKPDFPEIKVDEPEIKLDLPEIKPEIKPEVKPEIKAEIKLGDLEVKPEIKPDQPEIKPEIKLEDLEVKPEDPGFQSEEEEDEGLGSRTEECAEMWLQGGERDGAVQRERSEADAQQQLDSALIEAVNERETA